MVDFNAYITPLRQAFEENAHPQKAEKMKAYMLHQFPFYGIQAPLRRDLSKAHFKKYRLKDLTELEKIVQNCFLLPEREYHYFAIELFGFYKKQWQPSSIKAIEHCLLSKSWWDSVDHMASEWLGPFFIRYPELVYIIISKWNQSDNLWLQRSSILFQKTYKENTDTPLLSHCIRNCMDSKEYFIQKAIGWALREYAKTDPEWVIKFVKKQPLAPMSKREAIRNLTKRSIDKMNKA